MRDEDPSLTVEDDYFGFLDIVVVMAEWWLYISVVAAVAGGTTYFALGSRAPAYMAVTIADLSTVREELIWSEPVANRIVKTAGLASRSQLLRMVVIDNSTPEAARIEITGPTAEQSEKVTDAVVEELVSLGVPTAAQKTKIVDTLKTLDQSIEQRQQYLERLSTRVEQGSSSAVGGDAESASVMLLRDIATLREQRRVEEKQLSGFDQSKILGEAIVEIPTTGTIKRSFIFAGAAAFAVIAVGIVRELWRRAQRDPANRSKTDRIRRALFMT